MAGLKGRLLVLSWAMPPLVFPRSLQISRLLKALGDLGWQSIVVTLLPDAEPSALQDPELARLYAGRYGLRTIDSREAIVPSPLWLRLWRRIRQLDDVTMDNWRRRAERALRDELARNQYDALVTFAQPWVDHLVGLRTKRRYPSLPWVAHFSDPWVDSPYLRFTSEQEERLARRQERQVIETADAVVFVTQQTADLVMAKYPASWRSKSSVVGHGYDNDLLRLVEPSALTSGKFRVVHTGSLYGRRGPRVVLSAFADIVSDAAIRDQMEVEFIGYVGPEFISSTTDHGLADFVRFHGKKQYIESLQAAADADLLLLIDAPAELSVFLPSKLVDYVMLRRPILGITPPAGASAEVLGKLGCLVVPPDDVQAVAAALRAAFVRWKAGEAAAPAPDPRAAEACEIHRVAIGFARTLERAISAAPAQR